MEPVFNSVVAPPASVSSMRTNAAPGLVPVAVIVPWLLTAPRTRSVVLVPLAVRFSCEDDTSVASDRISSGLLELDEVSAITREPGSVPVAVTVPAVMMAVSPDTGATRDDQLPSSENEPSDPFHVLVAIALHL